MGYDLSPKNEDVEAFHFGAFSWGALMEQCSYVWPAAFKGGQWFCVFGVDERLGKDYPLLISNDGFEVTAEEACIMARLARNYVTVQRQLGPEFESGALMDKPGGIGREDLLGALSKAVHGQRDEPWPRKIREDFVDLFERFADWAPKSGGFEVW